MIYYEMNYKENVSPKNGMHFHVNNEPLLLMHRYIVCENPYQHVELGSNKGFLYLKFNDENKLIYFEILESSQRFDELKLKKNYSNNLYPMLDIQKNSWYAVQKGDKINTKSKLIVLKKDKQKTKNEEISYAFYSKIYEDGDILGSYDEEIIKCEKQEKDNKKSIKSIVFLICFICVLSIIFIFNEKNIKKYCKQTYSKLRTKFIK